MTPYLGTPSGQIIDSTLQISPINIYPSIENGVWDIKNDSIYYDIQNPQIYKMNLITKQGSILADLSQSPYNLTHVRSGGTGDNNKYNFFAFWSENEKKFGGWETIPGGGRRYVKVIPGRAGGHARYLKEVDAAETTLRFWQEIYDATGRKVAMHEKFPVDLGHKQL